MARRALGDTMLAEDAVQETLTRTLAALQEDRIERPERLGAFVAGIARHVIADALRERQRVIPLAPGAANAAEPPDALERLISEAECERVRQGLAELSDTDRNVLQLSYFDGLSPVEIASRTGEPATRVRKRKSRALQRLRRVMVGSDHSVSRPSAGTDSSLGDVALEPGRARRRGHDLD